MKKIVFLIMLLGIQVAAGTREDVATVIERASVVEHGDELVQGQAGGGR